MGNPDKTYDQIQREAVRVQCSQCGTQYDATHPRTPELCVICRPDPYARRDTAGQGAR